MSTPDTTRQRPEPPRLLVCALCGGRGQIVGVARVLGATEYVAVRDRCDGCLGSGWAPWETVQ